MFTDRLKKRKGQSLVETALILPILLIVLIGIVDFGLLFNNYLIISNASREGARKAAIGADDASISAVVYNAASRLDADKLELTISPEEEARKNGNEITVTITYEHSIFTPIISGIIPNPINLTSSTVMRIE